MKRPKPEDWKTTRKSTDTHKVAKYMALIEDAPEDSFIALVIGEKIQETTPGTMRVHWRIATNLGMEDGTAAAFLYDAAEFVAWKPGKK